ncbi:hypothetical protein O181_003720 [Austropuccinia psidii MF-1]|uniref:Uncharacterized protein n=1 Tax=Austropuccinia psidii MF-1 TaxID=1389203 RepID=A0A9Q3GE65_9BASI|nr:hypothetical protein [Austropuccinia psidii MF-1]
MDPSPADPIQDPSLLTARLQGTRTDRQTTTLGSAADLSSRLKGAVEPAGHQEGSKAAKNRQDPESPTKMRTTTESGSSTAGDRAKAWWIACKVVVALGQDEGLILALKIRKELNLGAKKAAPGWTRATMAGLHPIKYLD